MPHSLADTGEKKDVKMVSQHPKDKEPAEVKLGKGIRTIAPQDE